MIMLQRLRIMFSRRPRLGEAVYISMDNPKRRRRRCFQNCNWRIVGCVSLILLGLFYFRFMYTPLELTLPYYVDLDDYGPFEPEVVADFDTSEHKTNKIPRIIHQTWKDTLIPRQFVDNIKGFADNNPTWEYYLWTDDSARQLIIDHYPHILPVWDGYSYSTEKIRRADALRYIVLYHYGGVYADMDVLNFRSLDFAITKHPCVFMPEPFEHAVFRTWSPFLISNAIMICAPGHPFLKQLVENLYTFEHMQAVWDATGPGYVNAQYLMYNKLPREKDRLLYYNHSKEDNSPYFFKGKIPMSNNKYVYIANSQYFIFSLDEVGYIVFYWHCSYHFSSLTYLQQRACVNIAKKGFIRKPNKFSIMDHKWYRTYRWNHFYNYLTAYNKIVSTDIKDIVPNYKIYKGKEPIT